MGGSSQRWRSLFGAEESAPLVVAGVAIDVSPVCDGLCEWGFAFPPPRDGDLISHDHQSIDGVATRSVLPPPTIGDDRFVAIDHVVVNTDNLSRTSEAIEKTLGAPLRRTRDAGRGVSQGFHVVDNTVIEVVSGPHISHAGARLWGFVVVVDDIFDFASSMGPDVMTAPKPAVQPGRFISSVRSETALSVPVAFMSPRARGGEAN